MRNHVCQFSEKIDNFVFLGPNLPKNGFWSRNFKNLSLHSESTPLRYHVRQFSVKRTTLNFRPKFGEIVQLRAIFWFEYCWGCCKQLIGGWNELVGGGWSLVEVGVWYSNTRSYFTSAKRIATQILVTAKLNEREVVFMIWYFPSNNYLFEISYWI